MIIGKTRTNQPVEDTNGLKDYVNNLDNYEELTKEWNGLILEKEGITKVGEFCKVVRNFNELQFIMNVRLTNTTEDQITYSNDSRIATFGELPSNILEKIYAHNGVNLKEITANMSVAYTSVYISTTGGGTVGVRNANLFWINSEKRLTFYLENGAFNIPANTTYDVEARISLAL